MSGVEGKIRIAEGFAGQQNQVGLTGGNDRLGLFGTGNQPHSARWQARFTLYPLGKCHLITWPNGDRHVGYVAARRAVDQINTLLV